jgi:1,4-dihydroxy-2-naphthoate octaprenyltransferase
VPPAEPTLAAFRNPLARYFAAARPAFLSVTLAGCLLGLASAFAGGVALDPAIRATIGAALVHGALLAAALLAT